MTTRHQQHWGAGIAGAVQQERSTADRAAAAAKADRERIRQAFTSSIDEWIGRLAAELTSASDAAATTIGHPVLTVTLHPAERNGRPSVVAFPCSLYDRTPWAARPVGGHDDTDTPCLRVDDQGVTYYPFVLDGSRLALNYSGESLSVEAAAQRLFTRFLTVTLNGACA